MLVAFGGVYPWSYAPALGALAASAVLLRPRVAQPGTRTIDLALVCSLAWGALQAVPLPLSWRDWLSPNVHVVAGAVRFNSVADPHTLSLNPAATVRALVIAAMAAAMFWTTREVCGRYGPRRIVRTIAWAGLAITIVAIAALSSAPSRVYGIWDAGERARPFGPFVNRNHMGTWLLMAVLPVIGYIFARFQRRASSVVAAVDAPMVWLMGAASAMSIGIIVALSRSAIVGTVAGGLCLAAAAAMRRGRARWAVLAVAVTAAVIVATNPRALDLGRRFEDSGTTETWSRQAIWRETVPIIRDFPVTGVGLGSYGDAMLVYQQSDRRWFFNQAHNQYLQLAAEGGIALLAPLAVAALAFAVQVSRRLRRNTRTRSTMFWIRAGATAGIIGVLVQSVWETGLRLPANLLLFASLCAIAVHEEERE
jgi:O-antigen ligase